MMRGLALRRECVRQAYRLGFQCAPQQLRSLGLLSTSMRDPAASSVARRRSSTPAGQAAQATVESTASATAATGAATVASGAAAAAATAAPSFADSWVTFPLQDAISFMHHAFDMPFWAVVVCTTVAARTLLLPLFVIMQRNAARMKIVAPLIEEEKAAFEMTSKTSVDQARQARNIQKIFQENKVNPLKSLAPAFGQTPVFISFFWAFTTLHDRYPAVASESFLWMSNLSIPDPTYALPTAVAALYLAGVELGSDGVSKEQMGRGIWFMRALSLGFFYFAAQWSALFGLYLGTNSAASLVLAQVFKLQGVRKFFDIPRTPPPKLKADNSVAETAAQKAAGGELALKVMKAQKKAAVLSDAVSGAKLPQNAVSQQDLIRQRREAAKKVL